MADFKHYYGQLVIFIHSDRNYLEVSHDPWSSESGTNNERQDLADLCKIHTRTSRPRN